MYSQDEYSSPRPGSAYSQSSQQKPCNSQLELSISARQLINRDTLSKSDPRCVVLSYDSMTGKYAEIDRTEVIKDNLNPGIFESRIDL